MSKNVGSTTVSPEQLATVHKQISESLENLSKKDFKIYFYSPMINHPSGGVGVLFKNAHILAEAGYDVNVIYEPSLNKEESSKKSVESGVHTLVFDKLTLDWLDFDISKINFLPQTGTDHTGAKIEKVLYVDGTEQDAAEINLRPEDFVIIPEGFPNIMQQLANSPSKKIVLAQSWIYVLQAMRPGTSWKDFGITDVISVSDAITEYVNSVMPGLNIKQYSQAIDRNVFNVPEKASDKAPVIAFNCSRGNEQRMKTYNVIKTFQQWNDKNRFVRFVELGGLSREEYAERLKEASILLYTDDVAGFGTAPLEAMACGTHVVGWTPFGGKEYISQNNGFWSENGNVFNLAESLGNAVNSLLNGELDRPEIQASYESTLSRYTVEKEKESILGLIGNYVAERELEFKNEINEISKLQGK